MPNPSHTSFTGDPWHACDICGWWYRCSQLRRQPGLNRGALACPLCYDNPLTFYRDIIIQDNLSQSADQEMQVADILKQPTADDSNQY